MKLHVWKCNSRTRWETQWLNEQWSLQPQKNLNYKTSPVTCDMTSVQQFAKLPHRYGNSHATQCYLPPGRGDIPAPLPRPKLVLDLATPEGCKTELTQLAGCIPRWHTRPKTVTHPSTNRARRWLTSFMRRTPLTTTPRPCQHNSNMRVIFKLPGEP